jgi:hypothetical protein
VNYQTVRSNAVNRHRNAIVNLGKGSVLFACRWGHDVDVIAISDQATSKTLGESRGTVDIWGKSIGSNKDSKWMSWMSSRLSQGYKPVLFV